MSADPTQLLHARFRHALETVFGPDYADTDPIIRVAQNARFGDYQANVAMSLGKRLGRKPRDVATAVVAALQAADLCDKVEIAGPGFINLTLSVAFLERAAAVLAADERMGVERAAAPATIVIDYSSPNVAKQMHVGHLRSTVIGDALARTLEFLGHRVHRHNHVGDWGTQFGMLIEHLIAPPEQQGEAAPAADVRDGVTHIADLNAFYQAAKHRFDADAAFADRARKRVVALQSGDYQTLAHWTHLVEASKEHFNEVYRRLHVTLSDADIRPESHYNPMLASVLLDLQRITVVDAGAVCVFVPGFAGPDGSPVPLIVKKSDGGYGYAATDLAAIRERVKTLGAARILYVVDSRQADHFAMVFWTAQQMGWLGGAGGPMAEHVRFGMILGEDNKPFKTRSGGTVRLIDLLDEAEQRARAIVAEKNPDLAPAQQAAIAAAVGIGAVKYADLSNDRIKDYVFSWERMLAMDGNTAPYLQYAYARIQSLLRKAGNAAAGEVAAGGAPATGDDAPAPGRVAQPAGRVVVGHEHERALVLKLLQLGPAVMATADASEPHRLCAYLYELSTAFSTFYNSCPVLRAESDAQRASRLVLCALVARALKLGLGLLGIPVIERM